MLLLLGSAVTNATATPGAFATAFVTPAITAPAFILSQTASIEILPTTASTLVTNSITAQPAEVLILPTTVLPVTNVPKTMYGSPANLKISGIQTYLNYVWSQISYPSVTPTNNFTKGLLITWSMRVTLGTVQYYSPSNMTPVTAQNDWGLSLISKAEVLGYVTQTGVQSAIPIDAAFTSGENYSFSMLLR
jgi:hypothetical protein